MNHRRKTSVGFAIVAALAASTSSGAQARVVIVPEAHFKLEIPEAWDVSRKELGSDGKTWVVHLASEGRNLRLRVRATPAAAGDLRAALASWEKKRLPTIAGGYQRLEPAPVEKPIDGRPSLLAFYRVKMSRRTTLHKYRAVVMMTSSSRGWRYQITGFVQEDVYEKRESEIGDIIGSFDLLGQKTRSGVSGKNDEQIEAAKAAFNGKTRTIVNRSQGWTLEVPHDFDYLRGDADVSREGRRHAASVIASPRRNLRIFVGVGKTSAPSLAKAEDHFRALRTYLVKSGRFRYIEGLPGIGSEHAVEGRVGAWRSFRAYGTRRTSVQPYRIVAAVASNPSAQWSYTIAIAVHRDEFDRFEPVAMAILESFGPLAPGEVPKAPKPAAAGAGQGGGQ